MEESVGFGWGCRSSSSFELSFYTPPGGRLEDYTPRFDDSEKSSNLSC